MLRKAKIAETGANRPLNRFAARCCKRPHSHAAGYFNLCDFQSLRDGRKHWEGVTTLRILYLEDFEPDAALIRQYMGSTKHDFVSVGTIEEAQRILEDHRPDVFLVDIMIGGNMAYDLITFTVNEQYARHVVAVTARALPADQRRCL